MIYCCKTEQGMDFDNHSIYKAVLNNCALQNANKIFPAVQEIRSMLAGEKT